MWKPGFWNFGICSLISKSVLQPLECMFVHTDYRTKIVKLRLKYITSYGSWCIFIYDSLNGKWVQDMWKVKSFCRVECFFFSTRAFLLGFYLFYKSMCGHLLTRRRIMQHNSSHLPAFVCLSHELLSPYRLCKYQ